MIEDSSTKPEATESTSKSVSAVKTLVLNAKFEVEKFDGMNNFGVWRCEFMEVLIQQEDQPEYTSNKIRTALIVKLVALSDGTTLMCNR